MLNQNRLLQTSRAYSFVFTSNRILLFFFCILKPIIAIMDWKNVTTVCSAILNLIVIVTEKWIVMTVQMNLPQIYVEVIYEGSTIGTLVTKETLLT